MYIYYYNITYKIDETTVINYGLSIFQSIPSCIPKNSVNHLIKLIFNNYASPPRKKN